VRCVDGRAKTRWTRETDRDVVASIPPELRETVFVNACDIVLADGVVEPDEKAFIDDLMIKLEMDRTRAKTMVQVMVYKNQG